MSSEAPRLEAVVLDFDGVIVDSETPEYEAYRSLFEQAGVRLSIKDWTSQVGVWTEDQDALWHERLSAICPAPPTLDRFRAEKRRLFAERISMVPLPGIESLIDEVAAAGVPIGIASTSPARWVVSAAERLGVSGRVRTIVTADDVARRKPAPDVYIETLRRLGAAAARAVAIEDSAPGLAAALAAGLKTIVIPHRLTQRHDLAAADLRVSSATEITLEQLNHLVKGARRAGSFL